MCDVYWFIWVGTEQKLCVRDVLFATCSADCTMLVWNLSPSAATDALSSPLLSPVPAATPYPAPSISCELAPALYTDSTFETFLDTSLTKANQFDQKEKSVPSPNTVLKVTNNVFTEKNVKSGLRVLRFDPSGLQATRWQSEVLVENDVYTVSCDAYSSLIGLQPLIKFGGHESEVPGLEYMCARARHAPARVTVSSIWLTWRSISRTCRQSTNTRAPSLRSSSSRCPPSPSPRGTRRTWTPAVSRPSALIAPPPTRTTAARNRRSVTFAGASSARAPTTCSLSARCRSGRQVVATMLMIAV